jgi:hypothetical protein
MLFEAETNKYCPGGNDIGAISNLITWVLNFFLSAGRTNYKYFVVILTKIYYLCVLEEYAKSRKGM